MGQENNMTCKRMKAGLSSAHRALVATLIFFSSFAAIAEQGEQPRSNFIARAKLLASNELSVTISHSKAGQKNAFEFATQHCAKFNKLAVVQSTASQLADNITTWACVAPPQPLTPALPEQPPNSN